MNNYKLKLTGPNTDLELLVDQDKLYVGRGKDCHAYVDDSALSRKHVVIISQA